MIVKVVSYSRFSSSNQREESIEIQQQHINEYCKQNGLTIIKEYADRAMSATTDERPQFQQMIKDSENGDFSFVVIYNSSRFCRNVQDHLHYRSILANNNVRILSVQEKFDEQTPEGDLMSNFMMSINQYYSRDLSRKVYYGCIESAKQCKHVGGVPPLGYDIGENGKYIINEDEAKIVKCIFNLVENGYSYSQIAKILNEHRYKKKNGKPFRKAFTDLLNNRKYIGEYVWNKTMFRSSIGRRTSNLLKDEKDVIRIPHGMPAIITEKQFNTVQNIMNNRRNIQKRRYTDKAFLLSSLLKCGECNYKMSGSCNINGNGKRTHTRMEYKCCSKTLKKCENHPINAVLLDSYVLNLVNAVLLNEKAAKKIKSVMKQKLGSEYDKTELTIQKLKKENTQLFKESKNLVDALSQAKSIAYQEIVSSIERKTLIKMRNEEEIKQLESSLVKSPYINEESIGKQILKFKKSIADRKMDSYRRLLEYLLVGIIVGKSQISIIVNLNAYLTLKSELTLTMTIIEERENIIDKSKQNEISLTWSTLKYT